MIEPRTYLITGTTGGIGLEIALGLAQTGATVILCGRNAEAGAKVQHRIATTTGNHAVHFISADLALMSEVRSLADQVQARFLTLKGLINNAALLTARREITTEGFERMFAVNFLAPFYLTQLLTPRLLNGPSSHVINLASNAHRWVETLDFGNLQGEESFDCRKAYAAQKLGNMLHAFEVNRRYTGAGMTANAHHPGEVATNLGNRGPWYLRAYWKLVARTRVSPSEAALPIVADALAPKASGVYFERGEVISPSAAARDASLSQKLWNHAEEILRPFDGSTP